MIACKAQSTTIVDYLCLQGADLDLQDINGRTALMISSKLCNLDSVKLLLRYGARVDMQLQDNTGKNAYGLIGKADQQQVHQDLWKLLSTSCSDHINSQDSRGRTVLMEFCEMGYHSSVERLVKNKANVNLKDNEGNTALMIACHTGNSRIVEHLYSHGAELNLQDNKGRTALIRSCEAESTECMETLLKKGAQIDIEDNEGKTVLMMVDDTKKYKQQMLSEYSTSTHMRDSEGRTTLMRLCEKGKFKSIKSIAWDRNREDLNLQDGEDKTSLMIACQERNGEIVEYLCRLGAILDLQDNRGRTAVMIACKNEADDCVDNLLSYSAGVNVRDNVGRTALMWACKT